MMNQEEMRKRGLNRPIGWYDTADRLTTILYYTSPTGYMLEIAEVRPTTEGDYHVKIRVDGAEFVEPDWNDMLRRVEGAFWYGLHELVATIWDDQATAARFVRETIEEGTYGT